MKNETLVSSTVEQVQMWHGVGVVNGGFAARFATSSGDKVRLFKNDGTPITTNINLATVTGLPMKLCVPEITHAIDNGSEGGAQIEEAALCVTVQCGPICHFVNQMKAPSMKCSNMKNQKDK